MLYLGTQLGIYKDAEDTPFWGGQRAHLFPNTQGQDLPQEEEEAKAAAATAASSAKAVAKGEAKEGQEQGQEGKVVAEGNLTVEELRRRTKNTLYAAASALSVDGLQPL
eukprot:4263491-Lingulodinium_polyedra.AAC.1